MKRLVSIPPIAGFGMVQNAPTITLMEAPKKRSNNVSYSTRVDNGFIVNLLNMGDAKILGLSVDPSTGVLTIQFEKVEEKDMEKELAHEMR